MNSDAVEHILAAALVGLLLLASIFIIMNALFDIRRTHQTFRRRQAGLRLLRRRQPWVTVLLFADRRESPIEELLAALLKGSYKHLDIVLIYTASSGGVAQRARRFKKRYRAKRVTFYRRKNLDQPVLPRAYQKSRRGEIILTLTAQCVPPRDWVKWHVAQFLSSPDIGVPISVNAKRRNTFKLSEVLSDIVKSGKRLLVGSINRAHVVTPYETNGVLGYAADVLSGPNSAVIPRMRLASFLLGCGLFFITSLTLFMAATDQNTQLLLLGWIVTAVWFGAAICFDETIGLTDKMKSLFCLPLLYFFIGILIMKNAIFVRPTV